MKNLLLTLLSIVVFCSASMAQSKAVNKGSKPVQNVAQTQSAQSTQAAPVGRTKADGTPDKRYKENKKVEVAPAGPTKKDGTPDKRYKANKDAAAAPAGK